jgi:hypothetical protein
MDENPPDYIPECSEQDALIPLPLDVSTIEDIYTVGLSPMERWRVYIDCENWHPSNFHDKLMKRRAYHARCVWEACLLLSFTNSNWLTTTAYESIKNISQFELRQVEIEIMSYQLTCGMIGIACEKHPQLYFCAKKIHECVMFLADKILEQGKKNMEKRKVHAEIKRTEPLKSETRKQLGKYIDEGIFTIHSFLKTGTIIIDSSSTAFVEELSTKLRIAIIAFDKVAQIM